MSSAAACNGHSTPTGPVARRLTFTIVVVPALARRKLPDPVFLLAGGPGQSAIALAGNAMGLFQRLGNRRDLVFVDQRGTGRSAPLSCDEQRSRPLAEQADPKQQLLRLTACRSQLQRLAYGDLRFFTTTLAMQDLDAVRQTVGCAARSTWWAPPTARARRSSTSASLGPQVRRMVLDGVAPPDMVLPSSASPDAQAALDGLFAFCASQPVCAASHPRLREDWAALLASLPRSARLAHPLTGVLEDVHLSRDMVLAAVRAPLYTPALAAALPVAITEAAQGRFTALLGLSLPLSARKAQRIAEGMHFSVLCAEDYPRMDLVDAPAGADFGTSFARQLQSVCADWPRGKVPAAFYNIPVSRVPVLLLSGGLDPATPPRHAARVASALGPQARHLVVAQAGHGVLGIGCMRDVLYRFLAAEEDGDALAVDMQCIDAVPRPAAFQATTGPPR